MEDSKIVDLYFKRDTQAIEKTNSLYGSKLLHLAQRMLGSKEDALECVNDTLLNAWNAIPPERPTHLYAYLAKICRNIALNRIAWNNAQKRKASIIELTDELERSIPHNPQSFETNLEDLGLILNDFLKGLSKEKRIMFLRRYWYADSIKEIAKMCHCSQSKVKTTLFRIREQLKEHLEKEDIYL